MLALTLGTNAMCRGAHPRDPNHVRNSNSCQKYDDGGDDRVKCNARNECGDERKRNCGTFSLTVHDAQLSKARATGIDREFELTPRVDRMLVTASSPR